MRFGSVVFSIRNSIIGIRSQTSDVSSTRQLDDVGAVAIEDQDGPGAHRNPGARDRLEGDVPGGAVPDDVDLLVGRAVYLVGPAGMRAGQLEDHAAQGLGVAQHQGGRGAVPTPNPTCLRTSRVSSE